MNNRLSQEHQKDLEVLGFNYSGTDWYIIEVIDFLLSTIESEFQWEWNVAFSSGDVTLMYFTIDEESGKEVWDRKSEASIDPIIEFLINIIKNTEN